MSYPKIRKANLNYYSSKGKAIYRDFLTFAKGKTLSLCNALEFSRWFSGKNGEIIVCEYGVGDGDSAKVFLDHLKKINSELYGRTKYFLVDFSSKMLNDAKAKLRHHLPRLQTVRMDVASEKPTIQFHYCRMNELLSDLPAIFFLKDKRGVFRVSQIENGWKIHLESEVPNFVVQFLERIEEGRVIPFNTAAAYFLGNLLELAKDKSVIDIFDYGFYFAEDIFLLDKSMWNSTIARRYSSQITVDVNFPFLLSVAASRGCMGQIERQIEYAERILGKKLKIVQTDKYLDYRQTDDCSISEDDGFYHLRFEI
ncbi:MAG: SAM-dependent methyltransferase [Candidatus Anstonellaceae archaeon]